MAGVEDEEEEWEEAGVEAPAEEEDDETVAVVLKAEEDEEEEPGLVTEDADADAKEEGTDKAGLLPATVAEDTEDDAVVMEETVVTSVVSPSGSVAVSAASTSPSSSKSPGLRSSLSSTADEYFREVCGWPTLGWLDVGALGSTLRAQTYLGCELEMVALRTLTSPGFTNTMCSRASRSSRSMFGMPASFAALTRTPSSL